MKLKSLRIIAIVLFLGLDVGSAFLASTLESHYSFNAFIPEKDEEHEFYKEFKKKFDQSNHSIVLLVGNDGGLFQEDFLLNLRTFQTAIRKVPHITKANSILSMKDYIHDPFMPRYKNLLRVKSPNTYATDSTAIMDDPRMVNNYIDSTGSYFAIYLEHERDLDRDTLRKMVHDIRSTLEDNEIKEYSAVGIPFSSTIIIDVLESEFRLYIILSTVLMILAVAMMFRRFWGVVIALFSVLSGQLIFFGFLGAMGQTLNQMSNLYPILMVIVGTSDIVHLMSKYSDELIAGKPKREALKITMKEIGLATFMTSLTTAIGFASLATSDLPPVREFGLLAAVGVFIAYITVMVLGLILLSFFGPEQITVLRKKPGLIPRFNEAIYRLTLNRPGRVKIGGLLVLVFAGYGISQISTNLGDTRDFPGDCVERSDYVHIDSVMKGIASIDLALMAKGDHDIDDLAVMKEIKKVEDKIARCNGVGNVYSPLVVWRNCVRSYNMNANKAYRLPTEEEYPKVKNLIEKNRRKEGFGTLIGNDRKSGYLSAKVENIGSDEVMKVNSELMEFVKAEVDQEVLQVRQTGSKWIFITHQKKLVFSLMKSLGLAVIVVSIFMALVFRKISLLFISLIPNLIPLAVTGAMIGYFDFVMDAKVAIVFTIAFGIAVDDTIHFLSKFKLDRAKGYSVEEAIHNTFRESGKAITITTIILFLGFIILTTSAFPPTFMIGTLIAVTLIVALVADLLIIPILLRTFLK